MFRVSQMLILSLLVYGVVSAQDVDELIARSESPRSGSEDRDASLTLDELMKKYGVPGVSVAVISDFKIHWAKAYGVADAETSEPVKIDTLFQAASISKPVSALVTLRAVEDGKLSLDAPVNTLLTSWQLPDNELTEKSAVTPRMLLSHTGGTTVHGFPGYATKTSLPTVPQLLSAEAPGNTPAVFVDLEPSTEWRYSGGGTTIMQLAIGDVMGRPFPDLAQTYVLQPLGMTNSGYWQPLPTDREAHAARAHSNRGKRMEGGPWHVYPEMAAAGLWTTASDLGVFMIAVQKALRGDDDAAILQETAKLMTTSTGVGEYGLGFSVGYGGDYFGHGGSNWGFRCHLIGHKTLGYGFVIMTNGDNGTRVVDELQKRIGMAQGWNEDD